MEKINAASLLLYYDDNGEYEFTLSPIQLKAITMILGMKVIDIEKNNDFPWSESKLTYTHFPDEKVQKIIGRLQGDNDE